MLNLVDGAADRVSQPLPRQEEFQIAGEVRGGEIRDETVVVRD